MVTLVCALALPAEAVASAMAAAIVAAHASAVRGIGMRVLQSFWLTEAIAARRKCRLKAADGARF
jgi:hypothetical protein